MSSPRRRLPEEPSGQSTQPALHIHVHSSDPRDSDADASSDFSTLSELELQQGLNLTNLPSNNSYESYSDFVIPLSGRWDMASQWQLADYSEGVEGDADDDDDEEEHGFDTDLSEGTTGRSRGSRSNPLDHGRVQDIVALSPSSTPIILSGLPTMSVDSADNATGDIGSRTPLSADRSLHDAAMDSQSSTTTDDRPHRHSHTYLQPLHSQHHPYRSGTSERTVRFTRGSPSLSLAAESAPRQDAHSADTNTRRLVRQADDTREAPDSVAGDIQYSLPGGRSIGRLQGSPTSPVLSISSRINERRHALAHQHSLSPRHSFTGSSRSNLPFYWGPPIRHQQHLSSSSISSLASSPVTSESSSRMASPIIDSQGLTGPFKPQEEEWDRDGQPITRASHDSDQGGGSSRAHIQHSLAGIEHSEAFVTEAKQPPAESQHNQSQYNQPQHNQPQHHYHHRRRIISTTVTSLPSFVTSIFVPRTFTPGRDHGDPLTSPPFESRPPRRNHHRRPCCFLQSGQTFSGSQCLKFPCPSMLGPRLSETEEWAVKVTISEVDHQSGTVCGLMEALDVPMSASKVVTFWEGEIVDFENYTLWTKKWAARSKTDLEHWKRLEVFQGVDEKVIIKGAKTGKFVGHINQKYIFMRWKEKNFVNVSEHTAGLTIAGFYYISMRRSDGYVEGYYYDKQSSPFQRLSLFPLYEGKGFSSPIFEVA